MDKYYSTISRVNDTAIAISLQEELLLVCKLNEKIWSLLRNVNTALNQ